MLLTDNLNKPLFIKWYYICIHIAINWIFEIKLKTIPSIILTSFLNLQQKLNC